MLGEFGHASGFDVSFRGLEFAHQYGQRRVAQASIAGIPFGTESFDLVTAFDVLYSLSEEEEAAALAEIHRVLKPGGTLIVNVAALRILRGNHAVFGAEVRRSTRRRLRRLVSQAGFTRDAADLLERVPVSADADRSHRTADDGAGDARRSRNRRRRCRRPRSTDC